ncbi:venom carboxylesterase-6 isoform X2 [Harpegnathos saltator]|uniref:venom carboxylesterase-6 isoform X2 n=1 Tax=Harpegnathos saltator TaxID=610380 RepID=UPI00058BFA1F|nr:venom carboxylesterase-6 isoform X2 [Harpegnathos saltator]
MSSNLCASNTSTHTSMSLIFVRLKQGKLAGVLKEGVCGIKYKAFLGVPYATPPIGNLRFQDPKPVANWEGVRTATDDFCNMSAQINQSSDRNIIGNEDCLYLNIYVPCEWPSGLSCIPVMVWIHDGDFFTGNSEYSEIRPDYLMKKNVILVTVTYRLGVLGFLNLSINGAYGNQGLKDQVAALRWIQENIFYFGGDPGNITVFGNGTGAVSAHLLMLSPLSRGFFQKAILQSGVALCNWAVKKQQKEGFTLASEMGCLSTDPKSILDFLKRIPYRVLVMAEYNIIKKKDRFIKKVIFGPTIDKESSNPFLPCPVRELLNNGNDIPILIGHNTQEFFGSFSKITDDEILQYKKLSIYVEQFAGPHNLDKVPEYTKQIEQFYEYDAPFHTWHYDLKIRCLSDLYYNLPIRSVMINRVKQKSAKTYYYVFSYNGDEGKSMKVSRSSVKQTGTSHGDELVYIFYTPHSKDNKITLQTMWSDYDMINMITSIWSNFAKNSDPNFNFKSAYSEWQPIETENDLTCFEINRSSTKWLIEKKHLVLSDNWY